MQVKVCAGVVGVNKFKIMCNIGKNLKGLQKCHHCNPKKMHTDISRQKSLLLITEIDL